MNIAFLQTGLQGVFGSLFLPTSRAAATSELGVWDVFQEQVGRHPWDMSRPVELVPYKPGFDAGGVCWSQCLLFCPSN